VYAACIMAIWYILHGENDNLALIFYVPEIYLGLGDGAARRQHS